MIWCIIFVLVLTPIKLCRPELFMVSTIICVISAGLDGFMPSTGIVGLLFRVFFVALPICIILGLVAMRPKVSVYQG